MNENSLRSPTSEIGESFSVLRDSISVLEENKTVSAQLDTDGKILTLMLAAENGQLKKVKIKVNI